MRIANAITDLHRPPPPIIYSDHQVSPSSPLNNRFLQQSQLKLRPMSILVINLETTLTVFLNLYKAQAISRSTALMEMELQLSLLGSVQRARLIRAISLKRP